jgi:2-oxo-4-hydroxy-4-carboxy-5-ureidoimidazoline decarboxylase
VSELASEQVSSASPGARFPAPVSSVSRFNSAADDAAFRDSLRACCSAEAWVDRIVAGRPYPDVAGLELDSDAATAGLDDTGLAQALAGHPRIGERVTGEHAAWSRQEQSGVADAGADVKTQLAQANAAYEQRFGHVYLVCATGRSAEELLDICRSRLRNDPRAEREVVLRELAAINRLRLAKLLDESQ